MALTEHSAMTVAEFLDFTVINDGLKAELIDGEVVHRWPPNEDGMAPELKTYNLAKTQVWLALHREVVAGNLPFHVYADGPGVEANPHRLFIPDVCVEPKEGVTDGGRVTTSPLIAVEVLSPSTRTTN